MRNPKKWSALFPKMITQMAAAAKTALMGAQPGKERKWRVATGWGSLTSHPPRARKPYQGGMDTLCAVYFAFVAYASLLSQVGVQHVASRF